MADAAPAAPAEFPTELRGRSQALELFESRRRAACHPWRREPGYPAFGNTARGAAIHEKGSLGRADAAWGFLCGRGAPESRSSCGGHAGNEQSAVIGADRQHARCVRVQMAGTKAVQIPARPWRYRYPAFDIRKAR